MAHPLPTNWVSEDVGLLEGMLQWAYTVTNGWFFALLLLGFCVVMLIATTRYGTPRSFGFATFVGMIGATMFSVVGLMSWGVASIFIMCGFIGFVIMVISEK